MKYQVTTHKAPPPPRERKTGLSEALRGLRVNQSLFVPVDGSDLTLNQLRLRVCSAVTHVTHNTAGLRFSVRKRQTEGYDVWRIE